MGPPLAWRAAIDNPCATCTSTPCCTFLTLQQFRLESFSDLDYARFLLNFDQIELGLSANGEWSVYLTRPCRYLSATDRSCTVHGSTVQPRVCVNYNPYGCWYRRELSGDDGVDHFRIDRVRMELLVEHVLFDDARALVEVPSWPAIAELFRRQPLAQEHPPVAVRDNPRDGWDPVVLAPSRRSMGPSARDFLESPDPCAGCPAYCCDTLTFPHPTPTTALSLDFLRYCGGFPGVEIGLTPDGWSLLVHTRCRHLIDGRCAVFGSPERPKRCVYYDALRCSYEPLLGRGRLLRLLPEDIGLLAARVAVDNEGRLLDLPDPTELYRALRDDVAV